MRTFLLSALMLLSVGASACHIPTAPQQEKRVYRLTIRHADPQLIWMLLKGDLPRQPEHSTLQIGH